MPPIKTRLFTPGPVEIPPRVLRALADVPPHHRTEVFRAVMLHVSAELQWLHGTAGEVFVLAASGSGAMEAAVVNLLAPGQRALGRRVPSEQPALHRGDPLSRIGPVSARARWRGLAPSGKALVRAKCEAWHPLF